MKEDGPSILQAEIAVEDSSAEIILGCILQEPHSLILIFSRKDDKRLISPPSAGDDDGVIRFEQVGIPPMSFEVDLDEPFIVFPKVNSGQDDRDVALHLLEGLVFYIFKDNLHV